MRFNHKVVPRLESFALAEVASWVFRVEHRTRSVSRLLDFVDESIPPALKEKFERMKRHSLRVYYIFSEIIKNEGWSRTAKDRKAMRVRLTRASQKHQLVQESAIVRFENTCYCIRSPRFLWV
jgi:hypothetical protein